MTFGSDPGGGRVATRRKWLRVAASLRAAISLLAPVHAQARAAPASHDDDSPIASMPTALREANLSGPLAGVREGWWRTPTGAGLVAGEGVCACSFG